MMQEKSVTLTEFRNRAGQYLDEAAKGAVIITKHNRPSRVLIDIEEYERMKRYDTRQALYPHELSDEIKGILDEGYQGAATPELDHLLK
ncbi:MAG: type II toxin-antitoxin system Phd/YefM family antitoxin [Roseovarius sp.]|nr:type II toxin-antitoxin system Phd/YefM family antitoxin [Roseovarius sp.]